MWAAWGGDDVKKPLEGIGEIRTYCRALLFVTELKRNEGESRSIADGYKERTEPCELASE